jgi:hypothetical protein
MHVAALVRAALIAMKTETFYPIPSELDRQNLRRPW